MKVIDLPILVKSTQKDGILIRLLERNPSDPSMEESVKLFFAILAAYADPLFVKEILHMVSRYAQKSADLDSLLEKWRLPEGTHLVAIAPEYVPTKVRITDPAHPHYGQIGEIVYGEGDTLYLWVQGKMVSANLDQLERMP